jgi:NAD(P)-dependent dehydrogenase (short-subunit alcohol dehydrogenase family)
MKLKDRMAIVTGAARAIGQEFCVASARESAKVVAADILSCDETVRKVRGCNNASVACRQ